MVACKVLAKATLAWAPATRVPALDRPTTRGGREEQARQRQQQRTQRRRERQATEEAARQTHSWISVGSQRRCALCFADGRGSVATRPCEGTHWPLQTMVGRIRNHGHDLHMGGLGDAAGRGPFQACVVCMRCGGWASAAFRPGSLLLGECKPPTVSGREVRRRVWRGLHPKSGRAPPRLRGLGRLMYSEE